MDTITNPSVIIEILSKSKRDYDKGQKFTLYRDIDTLKEYILIDSQTVWVETLTRNDDNSWTFREYKSMDDIFMIETIKEGMLLSEIYFDVMKQWQSAYIKVILPTTPTTPTTPQHEQTFEQNYQLRNFNKSSIQQLQKIISKTNPQFSNSAI